MKSLLSLAIVLLCATASFAQENYAQWPYYRNVAVNTKTTGANVTANVTSFPLLVRLGTADSAVFKNAGTGGVSIRFAKADGTHFPYQIDSWDSAARTASVWVLVDTVKASDSAATLRLYWGRAGAVDSSNGTAVFSNGFTNAWHLGADSTVARPNSITTGNPAIPLNLPATYKAKPGVIGKADSLRGGWAGTNPNGSNHPNVDQFDLGATNINYSNGFTFSIWVLPTKQGTNVDYYVAADTDISGVIIAGTSTSRGAKFRQRNGNSGGNVGIINTSSGELDGLNTWRHVVYTKAAGTGTMTVYRDGASVATVAGVTAFSSQARAFGRLGVPPAQAAYADSAFAGLMDEARLSNVGRSAEWAKLEFETQKLTANAVTLDTVVNNQTVPGAPTNVAGVAGNTQVTVSWTAPVMDGNSPIASYTVTAAPGGATCTTPNGTTLNCTVTGLTNGTPYTFTVTATNGIGTSVASGASTAVTPTASAVAPGAPVSPVAVAGNASATVSWTAPASNGGSAITSYTARAVADNSKSCTTANGTTLTCTVTGLTNGTAYTFEVRATNAIGAGPFSSTASNAVTPNAPPVIAYATPKVYPTGTVIDSLKPTSTGGPITSYSINAALPTGLAFNTTTGAITGTPTAVTATTVYAIIATGPGGLDTASVSITVRIPVPVISYTPAVVVDSTTMPANHVPTVTGTVTSCTVNPALPAGLSLAATTCVISGTPTAATAATNYSIIATNSSGSDTATLNITVALKTVSIRGAYVFRVSGAEKPYSFEVPKTEVNGTEKVTLSIHDAYGRTVWSQSLRPTDASRVISWNGRTTKGLRASAGMYVLRVKVAGKGGVTQVSEHAVSLKP